jgi:segregation and condensation protein A
MTHTVAVGEFEGPIGVLLELINRGKLEVSRVSVGQITSEYLEKVRGLEGVSAEELSEFLQLGARLLFIKSLALLPQADAEEETRELEQLSRELSEYRRYQEGAKLLSGRAALGSWPRPAAPALDKSEQALPNIALDQLAAAFTRALKLVPPAPPATVIKPHLSLDTVTAKLRGRLSEGFALHDIIEGCHDRLEIVVTFLAVLELVRGGAATVTQASQFEPIQVEAARG